MNETLPRLQNAYYKDDLANAVLKISRDPEVYTALVKVFLTNDSFALCSTAESYIAREQVVRYRHSVSEPYWDWTSELQTKIDSGKLVTLDRAEEILESLCYSHAHELVQLERELDRLAQELDSLSSALYIAESRLRFSEEIEDSLTKVVKSPKTSLNHSDLLGALKSVLKHADDKSNLQSKDCLKSLRDSFVLSHEISINTTLETTYCRSLLSATESVPYSEHAVPEAALVQSSFENLKTELSVILTHLFKQQYGQRYNITNLSDTFNRKMQAGNNLRETARLAKRHNFLLATNHAMWLETSQMLQYYESLLRFEAQDKHETVIRLPVRRAANDEPIPETRIRIRAASRSIAHKSNMRYASTFLHEL